jgi:peptidoglycan/LPS O-acetylase OafA/YrhL
VLRLLPAAACTILASIALAILLAKAGSAGGNATARDTLSGVPWVILYAGNWARALNIGSLGLLGQTWSLSVEEQFYLAWPALFVVLVSITRRRQRAALLLAGLALADMAYRLAAQRAGWGLGRLYYGTDTHCDGLLLGCAMAFWLASARRSLPALAARTAGWLGALTLVILFAAGSKYDGPAEVSAVVLASAAVLAGLITKQGPRVLERFLSAGPAVWIGKRSYGLYLWHYPVFMAFFGAYLHFVPGGMDGRHPGAYGVQLMAFACSFGVAALSYRIVELPALRLKRRFPGGTQRGRHRRGAATDSSAPSWPPAGQPEANIPAG